MLRKCFVILVLAVLPFAAARGAEPAATASGDPSQPVNLNQDFLSLGVGDIGFDRDEPRGEALDFRGEYRFAPLVSSQNSWFAVGIDPFVGGEGSTRGEAYGLGGFAFDFLFFQHVVFTESEGVGFFSSGHERAMGSFIEFRSQAEAGWRFDNDMRLTGYIAHISNAGLTHRNPGEEIVGGYLHIPVSLIFGGCAHSGISSSPQY
jgi:lipid A 3-O-deacylase